MMKYTYLITAVMVISVFSYSCNNQDQNAAAVKESLSDTSQEDMTLSDDSSTTVNSIRMEDSTQLIQVLPSLNLTTENRNNPFDWHGFSLVSYGIDADSSNEEIFHPGKNFYSEYAPVLRWNNAKTFILDIGSKYMMPVSDENGHTTLEGGDPETEIALIDVVGKKKRKLLFFGPSSTLIAGKWLSDREILLIGAVPSATDNHLQDTLMYMMNVQNNFNRIYLWHTPNTSK